LLSAGELAALVADDGLVALRLGEDEIVRVGLPGGFFDFFLRSFGTAEADIVQNGIVKEEGVLGDNADVLAQGVEGDAAQVEPVEANGAALRIVRVVMFAAIPISVLRAMLIEMRSRAVKVGRMVRPVAGAWQPAL
jgi:hypothetical protein